MIRRLSFGALLALGIVSCLVGRPAAPRLTGTCEGACAHYIDCKPGRTDADFGRCARECPDVFNDPESLMAFESLSCDDAVEYVDGSAPQHASTR